MSTQIKNTEKMNSKQAGYHTTRKLIHQVDAHFLSIEIQVVRLTNGDFGKSSSRAKFNIGLLRRPQTTKVLTQKAGASKSTYEVNISDDRKEIKCK